MICAMNMIAFFLAKILPDPPAGTPNEILQDGVDFFGLWIARIGGFVAFAGMVKFALSISHDDAKEQLQSIFTMISGFMIRSAVGKLDIFKIPAVYTEVAANTEFKAIMTFIGSWTRRVGALGLLIGGIMFALAIKDNNAVSKITGLRALSTGAIIAAVSTLLPKFVV